MRNCGLRQFETPQRIASQKGTRAPSVGSESIDPVQERARTHIMADTAVWIPYCGSAPLPAEWLGRWNFDPLLLLALAGAAIIWRRGAQSREARQDRWFGAALGLLILLFVSPLCALSSALFSARVVHHVLLTAAVAPVIVLSLPDGSHRLPLSLPLWTAAQAVTFWAWHAPPLYAAALSNDALYWLMQLSLLGASCGFWFAIRAAPPTSAIGALLVTMMQMGLLGALITFAARPLYAPHFPTTQPWGLSALEDQQLAGLVMWAPSAGIYLGIALAIAARWLGTEGRAAD